MAAVRKTVVVVEAERRSSGKVGRGAGTAAAERLAAEIVVVG